MEERIDKAILFTDLHVPREGERIIGIDPLERFSDGLAHALHRHPDAAHVILMGDLTHSGQPEEYTRLRRVLDTCPIPVTLTLGNHDTRAGFDAVFPEARRSPGGFAQSALDLGRLRLLVLDTHDDDGCAPLIHDGWLCAARLAWLDAELARAAEQARDVVVICHHPPFPTGSGPWTPSGLAMRRRF